MKRNNLDFYDLNADSWWNEDGKFYPLNLLNQPRFDFFSRYITDWQKLKVLDVGCGGGFSCEFMAKQGVIVSGIDQAKACIKKAQEHAIKNQLLIDYKYGYAENLPYACNTFDAVICVDVLEHVASVSQTVAEVYRVLKPNGFFFFDTINRNFKTKIIMILLLEYLFQEIPCGFHDWKKFIKPEELFEILSYCGFINCEIKGFNVFGENSYQNLLAYIYYKKFKDFRISISDDLSFMYIGKAIKPI